MAYPSRLFFSSEDLFEKFEAFVAELLSKDLKSRPDDGQIVTNIDQLKPVTHYGKKGDDQRGVDLVGLRADGGQIVFQCKYRTEQANRRFGKTEARKAVQLAHKKYPEAVQYVLVTNHEFTPGASDVLNAERWGQWTSRELLNLVHTLTREAGYHLIYKHFDSSLANEMFPDGPNLLIDPSEYRSSFSQSQLSHEQKCVGREEEIERLIKHLGSTKPRAVLMVGKGGVGKSRVFCEVLERLSRDHDPNLLIRMVQAKQEEGSMAQISRKNTERIILGMDECHLPGYFREDVALALKKSGPDNRLLLATRPEGVETLREQLRRLGWAVDDQVIMLEPLGRKAMQRLVEEISGKSDREATQLAQLSDGNALVAAVGARLIRDEKLKLGQALHSDAFRAQVYLALEDGLLGRLPSTIKSSAKKALRVLAMISPWQIQREGEVCSFLDVSSDTFAQIREALLDSGLIKQQGKSCRVIPDLFAEHLSFEFFTKPAGNEGLFLKLGNSDFAVENGEALIRNLAVARWRERQAFHHVNELFVSLHEHFKSSLLEATDRERAEILAMWAGRAITAPEEVLELCRLALKKPSNPEVFSNEYISQSPEIESMRHRQVYQSSFGLLSEIIVGADDRDARRQSLELLWEHRDKIGSRGNQMGEEPPFRAFALLERRTEESWLEALGWLQEKLSSDEGDPWFTERSSQVRDFLFPALKPFIERTDSYGRSMQFSASPVNLNFCPEGRQMAFRIIQQIGISSQMGALNTLGLLQKIAWPAHPPFGGEVSEEWRDRWIEYRLQAVNVIASIREKRAEPIVQLKVRQSVRSLIRLNQQPEQFTQSCQHVLDQIPDNDEISLYVSLVSHDWDEFPYDWRDEDAREAWKKICEKGAAYLLSHGSEGLAEKCDQLGRMLDEGGWQVSWNDLFLAISGETRRIDELLKYLLKKPTSTYHGSLEYLCFLSGEKDKWLANFIKKGIGEFFFQATFALFRKGDEEDLSLTQNALIEFCQIADGERLDMIFKYGIHSIYGGSEVNDLILESIPWREVSLGHLKMIEEKVSDYNMPFEFPDKAFSHFLQRLADLPEEAVHELHNLVALALQRAPDAAFLFFHKKVMTSNHENTDVLPYDIDGTLSVADSESLANDPAQALETLEAILVQPKNAVLAKWYRIAFLDLHPDVLVDKIRTANADEFKVILDLLGRSRQLLCLKHPIVVLALLKRVETDFPYRKRDVESSLMRPIYLRGRSSMNGVPDDDSILQSARKFTSQFASDDILREFYQGVIYYEETEAARMLSEHEESMKRYDQFL